MMPGSLTGRIDVSGLQAGTFNVEVRLGRGVRGCIQRICFRDDYRRFRRPDRWGCRNRYKWCGGVKKYYGKREGND